MAKRQLKPEKALEQVVRAWCFQNGIWVEVFDSKAKFTERGEYKAQGLPIGTPDLIGLDQNGMFVAIELKSPLNEAIPSIEQRNYLTRVIEKGGFGYVCNDLLKLQKAYKEWSSMPVKKDRERYLALLLPKKAYIRSGKTRKIMHVA